MKSLRSITSKPLIIAVTASLIAAVIGVVGFNLLSSNEASYDFDAPGVEAASFMDGSLTKEITTEDCTLSNGVETTCYRIEVTGAPVDSKIGPFCPESTSSSAEVAGIWLDGEKIYDVDGQFILDLSTIYKDVKWKLYDESGKVKVTDTKEAFQGAARPDVQEAYTTAWREHGSGPRPQSRSPLQYLSQLSQSLQALLQIHEEIWGSPSTVW